MPELKTTDGLEENAEGDVVGRLSHSLDEWRARIDELLVQFDLAGHEVRDQVRKHVELTENVYLAARSQLSAVHRDANEDVKSLCDATEKLIHDLQQVYEAAEAAIRRGRSE